MRWTTYSREVTQAFHCLVLSASNLVARGLAHGWCVRPVVLAGQPVVKFSKEAYYLSANVIHVDRTGLGVNILHPGTTVPPYYKSAIINERVPCVLPPK